MKIMRKSDVVKEIPFEIHYEARFSEPFTTLELKFTSNPGFSIGNHLYIISENATVWEGCVTRTSFEKQKNLRGEYSVTARSKGFVLFQREARPAVYEKPSFGEIAGFHLSPHGIKFNDSSVYCRGTFAVKSNMNEWEVIEKFCSDVAGTRPFADKNGVVHSGEKLSENTVVFGGDVLSVKSVKNGETAVKTVRYKPDKISDYKFYISNESENAVCGSEKYENLSNLPRWRGESCLNQILKSSLRCSETLTVTADAFPTGCHVGDKAKAEGVVGDYRIESIDYRGRGRKTECVFVLLPENVW